MKIGCALLRGRGAAVHKMDLRALNGPNFSSVISAMNAARPM